MSAVSRGRGGYRCPVTDAKRRLRRLLARIPGPAAPGPAGGRDGSRICLRYRVTGLASEAGFFALLSLPPLVLGLFGGVGYVGSGSGRWRRAFTRCDQRGTRRAS
jgi:membrane protein